MTTPAGTPRLGPIDHARTANTERQTRHDGGPATAEQLLNLADRTRHGLTPDESARLRTGVAHHCARAEKAEAERDMLRRTLDPSDVRMVDEMLDEVRKLLAAEAAIERVRALASRWAVLRAYGSASTEIRAALAEPQEQQ